MAFALGDLNGLDLVTTLSATAWGADVAPMLWGGNGLAPCPPLSFIAGHRSYSGSGAPFVLVLSALDVRLIEHLFIPPVR